MLASRLKSLRKQTVYTQAELADKLGVARTTYAMYEQGNREPDNKTLSLIADFFNISIDYLLGRADSPSLLTKQEQDEAEFQAFANNPSLQKWYKELPMSREEDLEKLRMMWEIIKSSEK